MNPTNAVLTDPTNAVLTILDNTNAAFTFASATTTRLAGAGPAPLQVLRLNNTFGTATVGYATADGTAYAGTNYTATVGTLTFTNGVTAQTILVPLMANTNLTGNLVFTVGLTNPGSPAQLIAPAVATVVEQYAPPVSAAAGLYQRTGDQRRFGIGDGGQHGGGAGCGGTGDRGQSAECAGVVCVDGDADG